MRWILLFEPLSFVHPQKAVKALMVLVGGMIPLQEVLVLMGRTLLKNLGRCWKLRVCLNGGDR